MIGICPEVAKLLDDRRFALDVARTLRQTTRERQIECA